MTAISGIISTVLHYKDTNVWTISPQATVFEALQVLAKKNIGALPVVEDGNLIGLFSERDYTRKVVLEGKTSHTLKVREIITIPAVTISPNDTVEDAMRLMTEKRIRYLPVMEANKMIGIVSIGDMVNWIISSQSAAIYQMEEYIGGR